MDSTLLVKLTGPRVPAQEARVHATRYLLPPLLFVLAAGCLVLSAFFPWWRLTLQAPQYPGGLTVTVALQKVTGDVSEVDELNHYIGMAPLGSAARIERHMAVAGLVTLVLLVLAATLIHNRLAALLALPALLFPLIFLGDLGWWLRYCGTHLDPHAPLSHAIKPFAPPVLGIGTVGQFHTVASVDTGFMLAALASLLVLVALVFHRRAFRPLVRGEVAA